MSFFLKIFLSVNLYLLFFVSANAQVNLVPNPSFEDTIVCSTSMTSLNELPANKWFQYNSVDYYNHLYPYCPYSGGGGGGNSPHNNSGYQYPNTGTAYTGILAYSPGSQNYREWMQTKLIDSLQNGKTYCIAFYYNHANWGCYSVDKLGAYISTNGVNLNATSFIQYNPQIYTTPGVPLSDTVKWTKFSEPYAAIGGEKYVTLGNFFNNTNTNVTLSYPSYLNNFPNAYYLIDDISVIPTDLPAFAGRDTTLCAGDSAYIGRASEIGLNDDCIWYVLGNTTPIDTNAGIWVKPNTTTSYVVEQNICGTITYDTVIVNTSLSLLNFSGSYTICTNDSLQIGQAALPNVTYTWSPSVGLDNTTIAQPHASPSVNQIYSVTVVPTSTAYCSGIGTGTVSVSVKPQFVMSALTNTFFCAGDSAQIGNAPVTNINYQWQPLFNITDPNSSQSYVHPNINATYSLIATPNVSSSYCSKADTVNVQVMVKPQLKGNVILTASPKNLCPNQSTQLQPVISNSVGLQWSWLPSGLVSNPNIPNPTASPTVNASYTLITTADATSHYCGADTSKITIHIIKLQVNANAGRDTTLCESKDIEPITIGSSANPCSWCTYNWQPTAALQNAHAAITDVNGSFLSTIKNYQYILTKTDSCQSTMDTVNLFVKDCTSDSAIISVPNVFTPNGDTKNDTWSMIVLDGLQIFDLQTTVYNRWGKKVFESTNIHQNWNGNNLYDGDKCSPGSYFYIISYTDGNANETKILKGFIELIW